MKNNKETTVTHFRGKEELAGAGIAVKRMVLVLHNGVERSFDIGNGLVVIGETNDDHLISLLQGSSEHITHSLNMFITLIGVSKLPDIDTVELYQFMQNLTGKTLEGVDMIVKQYLLMRNSTPTPPGKVN